MNDKKENLLLTKTKIYLGVGVGAYLLSVASPASALVLSTNDNLAFYQTNSDRPNQTLIQTEDSSLASRRGGGESGESGERGESGESGKHKWQASRHGGGGESGESGESGERGERGKS